MKLINIFSLALFLILICTMREVSISQPYAIPRSVLGSGGVEISGAGNRIIGTVGQSIIGVVQNSSNKKYLGFWYTKVFKSTPVEKQSTAQDFYLAQSYPNPLMLSTNSSATLEYTLDKSNEVDLSIYDHIGRKIATLTSGMESQGRYTIQFTPDVSLPTGIYHVVLRTTDTNGSVESQSRAITLIR